MKRRRKPNCFRRKKFLRLLFGHFLFRCTTLFRLQTVITRSKSTLEAIDSAFSVDVLHLTGIERVACVANIDLHLIRCRTCGKFVSATAGNFNIFVLGMDPVSHFSTRVFSLDDRAILLKEIFRINYPTFRTFRGQDAQFFYPSYQTFKFRLTFDVNHSMLSTYAQNAAVKS